MRRPSFQFYPADWRNNAKLRRCSWGARGVWIELLGLVHDSDTYGLLHWPLRQIAQALGCPMKLLQELVDCGVLYGCESGICQQMTYVPVSGRKPGPPVVLVPAQEGPVWYSPRMVRDEYVRQHKGGSSRFISSPDSPPDNSPMGGIGDGISATPSHRQGDGSTSSSSSSSTTTAPTGASVDARQRFEMHEDWQPDEVSLAAQLRMLSVPPGLITESLLRDFVAFWVTKPVADSQGGWCHRLVKRAAAEKVRIAALPADSCASDWAADGVVL
jgi:hypothetical protein